MMTSAKKKSGRCVHCLQTVDSITADHVFPKSWYPDTTPLNLEKWTVPSCGPCNNAYGKIESDLLLSMAHCLDPKGEATSGIWQKALRSIDPEHGKNPLDALKRKLARQRFLKRVESARGVSLEHALPEINPDRPKGTVATLVSAHGLHRFVEKLVRGIVFLTERRYIEDRKIGMSLLRPEDAIELHNMLELFGELYERGSAIRVRKAAAAEAPDDPLFLFEIWNQFRVYAYIEDIDESAIATTAPTE